MLRGKIIKDVIIRHKAAVLAISAGCMLIISAASSAAFWTDMISLNQKVSSMTIGIKYDADNLGLDNTTPYLPGDSRDFGFKVINSGDISVDIKPVMVLTASNDMARGASEFVITDMGGNEVTEYTKAYYDKDGTRLEETAVTAGEKFREVRYELTDEKTLAGSMQKESSQGETESEKQYSYALKMSEKTGNDFKNTTASLEVSTYAIQHRNREADDEWISIAAER